MKKIMTFFLSVFLMCLFSCSTENHNNNVEVTPKSLLSTPVIYPNSGELSLTTPIWVEGPSNASDAKIYYTVTVGDDEEIPDADSSVYSKEFTLEDENLSLKDGDLVTMRILTVKSGFDDATNFRQWRYREGTGITTNDNAYLESISVTNADLSFSKDKYNYNISVANTVDTVDVTYKKSDSKSTVKVYPSSSKLTGFALTAGESSCITFTVTSSNKINTKRYLLTIYRAKSTEVVKSSNCSLASLSVSDATISFDKDKTTYDISLANTVEKVTVSCAAADGKATLSTTPASLTDIALTAGQTTTVSIVVTAEDGTKKTYTVNIYRAGSSSEKSNDATLSSLTVAGGSLSFSATTLDYSVTVPATYTGNISVAYTKNHSGASVETTPSNLDKIDVLAGGTASVSLKVTAEDGVTVKTYKITITKEGSTLSSNANLTSITLSNGTLSPAFSAGTISYNVTLDKDVTSEKVTATAEDSKATVSISPAADTAIASGATQLFTIFVTAEDGTPKTYTVSVKRSGDTPPPVETDYYWTNKDGKVGVNKTISGFGDWTTDMIIAQGAANDDPRAFRGYHEKAVDLYALFAAWDDDNLYLMVEMPSIDDRDIISKDWQYALDENLGMGVGINTGKGTSGDGEMDKGITVWNEAGKFYSIKQGIDTLLMFHPSEYGTPGLFKTMSDGKFSYDKEYCLTFTENGIETSKEVGLVSKTLYGRSDNYGLTESEYVAKTDYVDMFTDSKKSNVTGYMYQITISLKALDITKDYLTTTGISVMVFSTFGTSMMDALPWDSTLIDVAAEAYSKDDSTSQEKEDVDEYTSPLARVGKK